MSRTSDAVIREMPLGNAFLAYGSPAKTAHCPRCDRRLATYITDKVTVSLGYVEEADDVMTDTERAGDRVRLAEEFTNRGTRHPTDRPWYHRGRRPRREPMSIRVPAVVTCCDVDIALPSLVTETDRALATETADGKRETWDAIEAEKREYMFPEEEDSTEHDA